MTEGAERRMCGEDGRSCFISEWQYEMYSINPRAYGLCQSCGGVTVLLLPRQSSGGWGPAHTVTVEEMDTVQGHARLIVDATENALRGGGNAQRIAELLRSASQYLSDKIAREAVREAKETVRAQLQEQFDRAQRDQKYATDLLAQAMEASAAASRLQMKARRTKLHADIETLERQVKTLRKDVREQMRAIIAGARQPVAAPEGYTPPQRVVGLPLVTETLEHPYVIYAMVDAADSELVRYIGLTNDPHTRYKAHLRAGHPRMMEWSAAVKANGSRVAMIAVEVNLTGEQARAREHFWIRHYLRSGMADLNNFIPLEQPDADR